jgi:hypothetical protein
VVVVGVAAAAPVERLATRVADRIHPAVFAEGLKVAVHGGQADRLAVTAQLGVDLLGAAEAGQAVQGRG